MPDARARTVTATYEMQNVMWAIDSWPIEPIPPNSWKKKISRLIPSRISGVTIGRRSSVSVAPLPRNLSRARPSPSSEPRTVETTTAIAATWRVTRSASSRSSLPSSRGYQSRVNPRQTNVRLESLNEKMMRTTIGAKRNA
jgi:hypothetical protein